MSESLQRLSVLGIDGSPGPRGKTYIALEAILRSCAQAGTTMSISRLQQTESYGDIVGMMHRADALVIGSPVYRGSFAWPLKVLFDETTRGRYNDGPSVLRGKAIAIVMTTGSPHHFLALNDLRNVLAGFFAAHVVPPGLSIPASGYGSENFLTEAYAGEAQTLGTALIELAVALETSPTLRALEPQV